MKNKIKIAMLFAMIASAVFAVPVVTLGLFNSSTSGNYTATPNQELAVYAGNYTVGATNGTSFGTFCLEKNEYFSVGGSYLVSLSNATDSGPDVISKGTAWLYNGFATGTLSGYVYANQGYASEFQQAIWALEGEGGAISPFFSNLLLTQFGTITNAETDAVPGQYDVRVMNLTDGNGNRAQDQLLFTGVINPPVDKDVADSGSTIFLLAGVFGLMATRVRWV